MRRALVAMLLVACQRGAENTGGGSDTVAASSVVPAPATPGVATAPLAICPATGHWAQCSVVYRLERQGLVPRLDSAAAPTEPPLTIAGKLLRVGNSELELYFYPDVESRAREQRLLDPAKYVEYPAPVPMSPVPTLISTVNLIAILHSRNDHQRERVSDALTAGPPQPPSRQP